jgi:Xaa-Pro aminopeptidase
VGDYLADFEPGMVFTIEPGLYDAQANIGIRIEDVVVVTEDGCEVITARVPKAREEVVALIGETGVLDWMDG